MSNAKLKEQIEAAKIALVHSVESGTSIDMPQAPNTVTQIPTTSGDHAQGQRDRPTEMAHASANPETSIRCDDMASHDGGVSEIAGHEMVPQSGYEKLEARLQELEEQIRNQQRDLHTLLKNYVTSLPRVRPRPNQKKAKALKNGYWGACCAHLVLARFITGLALRRSLPLSIT